MYTLKRDNVVKLTDSAVKRDKYIAEGYKLVAKEQTAPAPEPEAVEVAEVAPIEEQPVPKPKKNDK